MPKGKKASEEIEKILEMGQESESKGKKAVAEVAKENAKAEKKKEDDFMERLSSARKKVFEYRKFLLIYLHDMVAEIDWPKVYEWGVWFDGYGVVLAVRDKYGKIHKKAFRISYEPKYDAHACYQFAVWAEDILDQAEGRFGLTKTQGGVYIPPTKKWIPN